MAPKYVTPNGLVIPDITTVLDAVNAAQRAAIDPNLDTSPESPVGQWNAPILAEVREVWEGVQEAYNGFNPNDAENFQLDGVSQITGTRRAQATFSRFVDGPTDRRLLLDLDASTTANAGLIVSQEDNPGVQFITTENVTSTTASDPDDPDTWYPVAARALVTGPIAANADTLTVIQTPQVGVNQVSNPTDPILGTDVETDADLRIRRQQELRSKGLATVGAVLSRVLQIRLPNGVAPIITANVIENTYDTISGGLPPHSIAVIVWDGEGADCPDDTLAQTIFDAKAGGIVAFGPQSGNAIDTLGIVQVTHFFRATQTAIKLRITYTRSATYIDDQTILDEVEAIFADTLQPLGETNRRVKAFAFTAILFRGPDGGAVGVGNITSIEVGVVGGGYLPALTDYILDAAEMPTLDTGDVELVNV